MMGASCAFGIAMARFELFPFNLVRALWNGVANKKPSADWYPGLRARYERMPLSADIVMFGDRHIRLMDWSELFPGAKIVNRGIPGDSVEYMLLRVDPILAARPKKVFVMGGVNDLAAGRDPAAVAKDYLSLIDLLRANGVQTIVQSTLLTANQELNFKISALNWALAAKCVESDCRYVDLNRSIAPTGTLKSTEDGMHLDLAGYMIWRDAIAHEIR
jgi:hypothetical protein